MTPRFAQLVNPYFNQALGLADRLRRREEVALERERRGLLEELDTIANEVSNDPTLDEEHFAVARLALIYWTDEILTMADSRWQDMTLEFTLLKSKDRAWLFYHDGVTKAMSSHPDVLEVFYLALALGFRGDIEEAFRFHLNYDELPGNETDPERARLAWAKELESRLQSRTDVEPSATPPGGAMVELPGHRLMPQAIVALTASVLFAGGLFAFSRLVNEGPQETESQNTNWDSETVADRET